MDERLAAIDPDEILDQSLENITAADLIRAVHLSDSVDRNLLPHLCDKKKYELWVEEGPFWELPVRELIERLRLEKKKVELELPWDWKNLVMPPIERSQFISEVAQQVQQKLAE